MQIRQPPLNRRDYEFHVGGRIANTSEVAHGRGCGTVSADVGMSHGIRAGTERTSALIHSCSEATEISAVVSYKRFEQFKAKARESLATASECFHQKGRVKEDASVTKTAIRLTCIGQVQGMCQ